MFKKKNNEEVQEVKEVKEPKKSKKPLGKGKGIPKPLLIVGVFILAIIIMVVIKGLTSKDGSSGGGDNFYSDLKSVFSSELGTFKYTIDVRSSSASEKKDNSLESEDVQDIESVDVDAESSEGEEETGNHDASIDENWGNKDNIETADWQYPNYKISIEGCTTSIEPLQTSFTISVATEYFNDKLTDITCVDGTYYIDIEQLRYWLVQSKDSYLIDLGKQLPEGSKYLAVPEEDFYLASRYAETGEKNASSSKGLVQTYRRELVLLSSIMNTIEESSGGAGLSSDNGVHNLRLTGADIGSALNGITLKSGDFYDNWLSSCGELFDKDQLKQAKREKDNVVSALEDLAMYMHLTDLSKTDLEVQGQSKTYENSKGNDTIEVKLNMQLTSNDTLYVVGCNFLRSGDADEITVPDGSCVEKAGLSNPTLITDTFNSMIDYFNITPIKLGNELELTPDNIVKNAVREFIDLVNSTGTAGMYVTEHNFSDFLNTYKDYEITSNSTKEEAVNATLVSDFILSLETLGAASEEINKKPEQDDLPQVEMYPTAKAEIDGVSVKLNVLESKSSQQVIVVNLEASSNKGGTLDLTNFSLQTLLSSVYPSNNEVLLRNYDNNFDFDKLKTSLEVPSDGSSVTAKLYFVISEDLGYMDIWYGNTNLGEVINH